jgi:hypothetical protein
MISFLDYLKQTLDEADCRTPVERKYYKAYRHLHFCNGVKGKSSSGRGGPYSDTTADVSNGDAGGGDGGGGSGGAGGGGAGGGDGGGT